MGTHPIFESDFDCLTESERVCRNDRNDKKYYSTTRITLKLNTGDCQKLQKETWDDYVKRLDLHDRQELERSLRNLRREENTVIDLDPKAVNTKPPSMGRCKIVFIYNFVPFIFFGFLDNCLMILFG